MGGVTGNGYTWLLKGIQKYKEFKNKINSENEVKNTCFECKLNKNANMELTDFLNYNERFDLENSNVEGNYFDEIIKTGDYTKE